MVYEDMHIFEIKKVNTRNINNCPGEKIYFVLRNIKTIEKKMYTV